MKNSMYPMPDKAWPMDNSGNPQPDSIQLVNEKVRRMIFSTARRAEIIDPMTGGIHRQVGEVARQPKSIKRRRDGKGSGTVARLMRPKMLT